MNLSATDGRILVDRDHLDRTLRRIAHEVVEKHDDLESLALVGIYTRGVAIAERLAQMIEDFAGVAVPVGALDIGFYRDDVTVRSGELRAHPQPLVRATRIEFPLDGRSLVLVDDVLYTGRTIRAAIDAVFDYGRPNRVQLAVLVDRGHRELPIRADYVGKNVPTSHHERVSVLLEEIDGDEGIVLSSGGERDG